MCCWERCLLSIFKAFVAPRESLMVCKDDDPGLCPSGMHIYPPCLHLPRPGGPGAFSLVLQGVLDHHGRFTPSCPGWSRHEMRSFPCLHLGFLEGEREGRSSLTSAMVRLSCGSGAALWEGAG